MRRAVLSLALLLTACAGHQVNLTEQAPATFSSEPGGYEAGVVTRVIDGDTIEVEVTERVDGAGLGDTDVGQTYDVRLVGIDTPESVKPGSPVECFGKEASAALDALLGGQAVRMVKDVENTDQYDRLLRYVYIGDEMANARLVVNGYAAVYTYPPNVRHADLFVEMQRQARDGNRGLWSPETCSGRS
ncbi:MAG: thermonuclease family protein [Actinomycetota bacterium]